MQPGQFLINKDGEKRKILGVCGEIYFVSQKDSYQYCYGYNTEKELENAGWSLLEEPWVPKNEDWVWVVFCGGDIGERKWDSFDEEEKNFVLNIGNYGRTKDEAKLHRQKLIERMGKKE